MLPESYNQLLKDDRILKFAKQIALWYYNDDYLLLYLEEDKDMVDKIVKALPHHKGGISQASFIKPGQLLIVERLPSAFRYKKITRTIYFL